MTHLDVITGFLGAGKTTFLRQYTRYLRASGIRYALIENEFGRAGVDAEILEDCGAEVLEISGGCICCTLKVTMHDLLRDLCGQVDRILLEPSGVFCGDDLCDILASPDLSIALGAWIGLLDPTTMASMTEEDRAVLLSEIIHAGTLLVTKTDIASADEIAKTERDVLSALPVPTPYMLRRRLTEPLSAADFRAMQEAGTALRPHERRFFDHTGMFQSITVKPKGVYTVESLGEIVTMLFKKHCGDVLRVKGNAASTQGSLFINATPGCVSIQASAKELPPILNIIGRNLQRNEINTILS